VSRIDEKTLIPLSFVGALFSIGIMITAMGVYWMTSVNERLGRIEQRLGIMPISPPSFIPHAEAASK
jgi:hypothetical protein